MKKMFVVVTCVITCSASAQKRLGTLSIKNKASIYLKTDVSNLPDSLKLQVTYHPYQNLAVPTEKTFKQAKGQLLWTIPTDNFVNVGIDSMPPFNNLKAWLLEPGDSVIVNFYSGKLTYEGCGSEKLKLADEIDVVTTSVPKTSNPTFLTAISIQDYLEYNNYLKQLWSVVEPIISSYEKSLSQKSLDLIKGSYLTDIEYKRNYKMLKLYELYAVKKNGSQINADQLCSIFDSTFFSQPSIWVRSLPVWIASDMGYLGFIRTSIMRENKFASGFDIEENFGKLVEYGKKEYNGLAKEYYLTQVLTKLLIDEIGLKPQTEQILTTYYGESHNQVYKQAVKDYESEARLLKHGQRAPQININNSLVDYSGKLTLLNFEIAGEDHNTERRKVLEKIRRAYLNDTNLVILNFSDQDPKEILQTYNVSISSGIYLVDYKGSIVKRKIENKDIYNGSLANLVKEQLTALNEHQWVMYNDGPYLISDAQTEKAYYISNNKVVIKPVDRNISKVLVCNTDQINNTFEVHLKNKLSIEPDTYKAPEKLLALSDIEGNFDSFRKLLRANNVIDDNYNWTFANGHLVFDGDLFDRGDQVTECLWLIYSLEDKAKSAGGYVHFILGNHEIMNLSGDLRYVQEKYKHNSHALNKEYANELYGENSELGKWLRTKNIIEKIGDFLFVHGGISPEVSNLSLSINEINSLSRKYYDKSDEATTSRDLTISTLYNSNFSPFWYRLYYQKTDMRIGVGNNRLDTTYKTPMKVIDSILEKYQVNKIVTGHTIYKGDNGYGQFLSVHYNGKVINLDTRHSVGYSEALYFENSKYYRVNTDGNRQLLSSVTGNQVAK